jgi:hypothetical protein
MAVEKNSLILFQLQISGEALQRFAAQKPAILLTF